jgi:glycosyltransferase involved in cell wall biosynthesis
MAMEQAIVSTTVGAEGLPVQDGAELLLADKPEAFADAVVRVLRDEMFARELGARAAAAVRQRFGWDRVAQSFAEACECAVARVGGAEKLKVELQSEQQAVV